MRTSYILVKYNITVGLVREFLHARSTVINNVLAIETITLLKEVNLVDSVNI